MSTLQHYYTSFVNKETNSAGFQVKAMSSGISPELQLVIARLIIYRIPSAYYEQDLSTHPIALRYLYRQGQTCILLCSQSNGNDDNGRPGNFFAHTLVMEADSFTSIPPIFYWRSSFWCKSDDSPRSVLLPLESSEMVPALDIEQVWAFLSSEKRREQFFRLMCAVVHSKRTQRKIVIIDTADNVALWIAAVSAMLPPAYRPLLSFATYHHNPYQSPFLITGTTSDAFFRALSEEYTTYFILNVEQDRVSEVDYSLYAETVVDAAYRDRYETQLLPIFSRYANLFLPLDAIDERLDEIVTYAQICATSEYTSLTADKIQVIQSTLTTFAQISPSSYTQSDLSDLTSLARTLLDACKKQQDDQLMTLYLRVQELLTKYVQPTNENILELLKFCTDLLLANVTVSGHRTLTIEDLRRLYKEELLVININSPEYLNDLESRLKTANASQLTLIWQQVGQYLMPSPHSRSLLLVSLQVFKEAYENNRQDGECLFQAMQQAMVSQGQEPHWFTCAVEGNRKPPKHALILFYCKFVFPITLEQRVLYRDIVRQAVPDIVMSELIFDIDQESLENGLHRLENWIRHGRNIQLESAHLIQVYGLPLLEKRCPAQQWQKMVTKILISDELAPLLSPQVKTNYLAQAFSGITFSTFSPEKIALYKRYQHDPLLLEETRAVITVSLGLARRQLSAEQERWLHAYVAKQIPEQYCVEIDACMKWFFSVEMTDEVHNQLVGALFLDEQRNNFWKMYWRNVSNVILSRNVIRALDILSCWFEVASREHHLWQHYIVQDFFLRLRSFLRDIREYEHYDEIAILFDESAKSRGWYPSLRPLIKQQQKTPFPFTFPRLTQKPKMAKKGTASRFVQVDEMTKLFEYIDTRQRLYEQHVKSISLLYNIQQHEQFWTYYWRILHKILTQRRKDQETDPAEIVLRILAFWFDDAITELGQIPHVVPEFFLGLPHCFLEASKTQEFHELLVEMNEKVERQPEHYKWYMLVMRILNKG